MARLTLVAEPFPDWEASVQRAAARDLTDALALTAPRSCSVRYLAAADSALPPFGSARVLAEHLPLRTSMLPVLWQSRATARPLDGEFAHALTPMLPLRARTEDDGSQSTVTVPHTLAWEAPDLLTPAQARLMRAFVKRAAKLADVILTHSYAAADTLTGLYGSDLPVQVLPFAAPREMRPGPDAAERRDRLELPDTYWVTTARDDARGRLNWVFAAMLADPAIPHLVVLNGLDPAVYVKGRKPAARAAGRTAAQTADARADAARLAHEHVAAEPSTLEAAGQAADAGAARAGAASIGAAATSEFAEPAASPAPDGDVLVEEARSTTEPTDVIPIEVPDALRHRVTVLAFEDLNYVGAVLGGASLMLQPQSFATTGYTVIAALQAGVPLLYAGVPTIQEFVIDAGRSAETEADFTAAMSELARPDNNELARLTVIAGDRGRSFSWQNTAWHLWQTHADI